MLLYNLFEIGATTLYLTSSSFILTRMPSTISTHKSWILDMLLGLNAYNATLLCWSIELGLKFENKFANAQSRQVTLLFVMSAKVAVGFERLRE